MIIPNLDKRNEKDIIAQIKDLAKQFVPEWNFSETTPDFGVIFAKVFAKMFLDTITRYNKMPYNHYAEFLNVIGANAYPPIPASGMVTAKLRDMNVIAYEGANTTDSVFVKKDEQLYAISSTKFGRFIFNTTAPMVVTFNEITAAIVTCGSKDVIYTAYKSDDEENDFRIFNFLKEDGIQKHEIYFKNNEIFSLSENRECVVTFEDNTSVEKQNILNDFFSDTNNIDWQYFRDNEWRTFEHVEPYKNAGVLLRSESKADSFKFEVKAPDPMAPIIISGVPEKKCDPYCIRAKLKNVLLKGINFSGVFCMSKETKLFPEKLYSGMNELALEEIFPFGETYNIYDNFSISSPVFLKKNADVEISIEYNFIEVESDIKFDYSANVVYKNLMDKIDFQQPEPPKTEIKEVIWEYWNGKSWCRLFKGHEYEDAFCVEKKTDEPITIKFKCPEDLEEDYVMGPSIRVRPTKIKNLNVVNAIIASPFIKNIKIKYSYEKNPQLIKNVYVSSNSQRKEFEIDGKKVHNILDKVLDDEPMTYFCMKKPLDRAPIKIFFEVDTVREDLPVVIWQYAAQNKDGSIVWKSMDVIDLTSNFHHSGIVTVMGKKDFAFTNLFGKEGYFFRIVNKDKEYLKKDKVYMFPKINNILFNTVEVQQVETVTEETFMVQKGEKNKVYKLLRDGALNVDVYVNEFEKVTSEEQEELMNCKENQPVYDDFGNLKELWVKWKSVLNIKTAQPEDRVYEVDYLEGSIKFGDGRYGKIPSHQSGYNVRVSYQVSDGSLANIDEGKITGFYALPIAAEKVTNFKPMFGGIDKETSNECKDRVMKQIPGVGRIVSLSDFEDQVRCFCRDVDRIKCIPHVNKLSQEEFGMISIAVVPKNNFENQNYFLSVEKNIKSFLKDKVSLNLLSGSKISVFEVSYVKVSVQIEAMIESYDYYQQVYQNLNQKIETFLNPIKGNFDGGGWDIGCIPTKEAINNCVRDVEDLTYVKNINVFYKMKDHLSGETYVDEEFLDSQKFVVPMFDEATIDLSVYR